MASIGQTLKSLAQNKLFSNFIYLYGLQAFNFILPLLTFPYLIQTLQPELYGTTLYSQTMLLNFIIIIEYSHNVTAIRKVSIHRNHTKKVQRIFNRTVSTKIYLFLISLILLALLVCVIPKLSEYWLLYVFGSGLLIGQVIFPVWLFQGLQEMKYLLIFNVITKSLFTLLIFLVIKEKSDYLYVNLIQSFSAIITGIISFRFIIKKYNIQFKFIRFYEVVNELKTGFIVFLSNFLNQAYVLSNFIILGFFSNELELGNYSIAERIMLIIRQITIIFTQVIYPHVCEISANYVTLQRFYRKVIFPFTILIIVICLTVFIFSNQIVHLLVNKADAQINTLLQLLCIVPVIVVFNIAPYQTLLAYNQKKKYSLIIICAAVINIISNLYLSHHFGAVGTIISIIATELFVTMAFIIIAHYFIKKSNFLYTNL